MINKRLIEYSIIHNKAVNMLAKKYNLDKTDGFMDQIRYHDMDKVLNYFCEYFLKANQNHIFNSNHHLESDIYKTKNDLYEIILDWESARYTKKDKPLNAYQTLNKLYKTYIDVILPILKKLKLDYEYIPIDDEIVNNLKNIHLDYKDILSFIIEYIIYLKNNNIKTYFDLEEVILKVYNGLNKIEQEYFKTHIPKDVLDFVLNNNKNTVIGIFTHKSSDDDAICSVKSLAIYINSLFNSENVEVIPIVDNNIYTNNNDNIKTHKLEEVLDKSFDYAIICDVNEYDRVYGMELVDKISLDKRYLIDHHDQNRDPLKISPSNKIVFPNYSSTCEIIADLLMYSECNISKDIALLLYRGIASDTECFARNVTENTMKVLQQLNLTNLEQQEINLDLNRMTPKQEILFNKIKSLDNECGLKIYTLLEPIESGDITKELKHKIFSQYTSPTVENPVTCFIIGCGNNYFLKFRKLPECDVDILAMATSCNGGGHTTRCAGRFYNSDFDTVLNNILELYKKNLNNKKKIIINIKR